MAQWKPATPEETEILKAAGIDPDSVVINRDVTDLVVYLVLRTGYMHWLPKRKETKDAKNSSK